MTGVSNTLTPGFFLQEYRVDSVLGAGGFGITYKAWDTHLDTWVAIKEYFPAEWCYRDRDGANVLANTKGVNQTGEEGLFDYQWGLSRFLEEARVLARVQNPDIVRVKRYFKTNGTAYFVMDFEEGEPLNRRLRRVKTLEEAEILRYLRQLLPALQSVHDQGFWHRDIKPSNLYIRNRDSGVMLIDFGAARQSIGRGSRSITGLVTPGYSPPEQYAIRSDRYGNWTDIYALGAVLYRCVSGQPPLEGAERLLEDRLIPARDVAAGHYSETLLAAIDRALAVRPEARFQSALQMQDALASLLSPSEDVSTRGPLPLEAATRVSTSSPVAAGQPRQFRLPWWLGLPFTLALGASVWWLVQEIPTTTPTPVESQTLEHTASEIPELPRNVPAMSAETAADVASSIEPIPEMVGSVEPSVVTEVTPAAGDTFIESHIQMPMGWVPAGCFQMGSPMDEVGREPHEIQHQRCLEKGFWLGHFEVTNAQFRQFREAHDSGIVMGNSFNDDDQPAVQVSWHDAMAFARWLSVESGFSYRLPDEIEWEYAARAGTTTARYWGDDPQNACEYANASDRSHYRLAEESGGHPCDDAEVVTAEVGSYEPNPWGFYDMLGNAFEWTCSVYQEDPRNTADGCPPEDLQDNERVLRGSSWVGQPASTRAAHRRSWPAEEARDVIGFRLLREEPAITAPELLKFSD